LLRVILGLQLLLRTGFRRALTKFWFWISFPAAEMTLIRIHISQNLRQILISQSISMRWRLWLSWLMSRENPNSRMAMAVIKQFYEFSKIQKS
jgi:hypothetical protein